MNQSVYLSEAASETRRVFRRPRHQALLFLTYCLSLTLCASSFALFHTLFIKRPDFDAEGRLFLAGRQAPESPREWQPWQYRDYLEIKARLSGICEVQPAVLYRSALLKTSNGLDRVLSAAVTPRLLSALGAVPVKGRLFIPSDAGTKAEPSVILSETTWGRYFEHSEDVIGKRIVVDGVECSVVGVMDNRFRFPNNQEIWLPLAEEAAAATMESEVDIVLRLHRASDRVKVQDVLQEVSRSLAAAVPATSVTVRPLRDYYVPHALKKVSAALCLLSLLLLVACCFNAGNLMLIESLGRRGEWALMLAVGLPRAGLIRRIFWQVLPPALLAVCVGIAVVAYTQPKLLPLILTVNMPYWFSGGSSVVHWIGVVTLGALLTGATLAVPCLLLFGVEPRRILSSALKESRTTGRKRLNDLLLFGQVVTGATLIISAVYFWRSSQFVDQRNWGFLSSNVMIAKIDIRSHQAISAPAKLALYRRVIDRIEALPGVQSGAIMAKPLGYSSAPNVVYALRPEPLLTDSDAGVGRASNSEVTEHFFSVLGIPQLQGAPFDQSSVVGNGAIINQGLAKLLWPDQDPIGRNLFVRYDWMARSDPPVMLKVAATVRDFAAAGPLAANNDAIYIPFTDWVPVNNFLLVRGSSELPSAKTIQKAINEVDTGVTLYFASSLKHQVDLTLGPMRITAILSLFITAASLAVMAIGIYTISTANVIQREREFGVKLALGATPRQLWIEYVCRYLYVSAGAFIIGCGASAALLQFARHHVSGFAKPSVGDFITGLGVLGVTWILTLIPSTVRLFRVHPTVILR